LRNHAGYAGPLRRFLGAAQAAAIEWDGKSRGGARGAAFGHVQGWVFFEADELFHR
jgi:hypothetical protein